MEKILSFAAVVAAFWLVAKAVLKKDAEKQGKEAPKMPNLTLVIMCSIAGVFILSFIVALFI